MTWEYALIGLVVGIIIGAVTIRFGNRKLRQQQILQHQLERNKIELDNYRQELTNHFVRSAELLDNIANDYRQLYQHISKGSISLLPSQYGEDNPFLHYITNVKADNNPSPAEIQPRDYQDGSIDQLQSARTPHRQ